MAAKLRKTVFTAVALLAAVFLFFLLTAPKSAECTHDSYRDGLSEHRSVPCDHSFEAGGLCSVCGIPCTHDYRDGVCNLCGKKCVHIWTDGACAECGIPCGHKSYVNGKCPLCGGDCPHAEYENSVCSACGVECPHEAHSPEQGVCLECGVYVFHDYSDGICTVCGRAPVFYDDFLPEAYYLQCENQGSVQQIDYTARNYWNKSLTLDRTMMVWTPWDYNEETKYNVLILMHGGRTNYTHWMNASFSIDERTIQLSNIYDRVVEEGNVAPFLIVSIPAKLGDDQLAFEIRDAVLPYIVEHYSTWAESPAGEDIAKARDHFGIGGLSDGAIHTFHAGMGLCYDLFGNYMGLSGNRNQQLVEETITGEAYSDLSVRCLFAGCGTLDGLAWQTSSGYQHILDCSDGRMVEGRNAWYLEVKGGHDWKVWSTEIVNALQVMF